MLGISETNVATKINRLKNKMKQEFRGTGQTESQAKSRTENMMELDELKQKWAEHDRKLEVNIRLTRQLLSATKMNRARSALQRLAVFLALESVVALALIIVLGSFIGDHIAMVRFVVPAAALDLFEIATLIVLIQQIRLALYIEYSRRVAAIQKQLESLRMLHIRPSSGRFC